jgi:KDO2-lipid IV(A) lauroyltransferase
MLSDSLRLKQLDSAWVAAHLHSDHIQEFRDKFGGKPVLLLGVHLGSFDLLAWAIPYLRGGTMTFIVRNFKSERLDLWFRSLRESSGNTVIGRERGLRKLVGALKGGSAVGFLFDQNVTRNHALFLPWFDHVAATTVAPGTLAALGKCPVVMVAIRHRAGDDYSFVWTEIPTKDLYESNLGSSELMRQVTERAISVAEKDIRSYPHGWFWIHRRWKTTPEGIPEDFYRDC